LLRNGEIKGVEQDKQLENPDARVVLDSGTASQLLGYYTDSYWGLGRGDYPRFGCFFWEIRLPHGD
ncbi:MAG: hypothetical protein WCG29_10030, partial [Desulfomonile sp.]